MNNSLMPSPGEVNYLEEALSKRIAIDFNELKARKALENLLSQPLMPFERDIINGTARKFVKAWFVKRLSDKFPMLSKEIYELKRRPMYKGKTLEVPMIFSVNIDGDTTQDIVTHEVNVDSHTGYRVKAQVPDFPLSAKEAYVSGLQFALGLERRAYSDGLLKRILLDSPDIEKPSQADYSMIWSPDRLEFEDISPPPKDPALIMTYAKIPFVLHVWKSEDEYDIENTIREFIESFPPMYSEPAR